MKKLTEETHPQLYEKEEFGPTFGHLNQKRNEFKTEMTPQREQTCTARWVLFFKKEIRNWVF